MAIHLGRLKIVTRRKDGLCRYKHCPEKDHNLSSGEKVLILTKMGSIGGRPTIFYKSYHPECFGHWALWMVEQTPISKDGRRRMDIDPKLKEERAKLVRERARVLRAIRNATPDNLESKVQRIGELDKLIADSGYPVLRYKGRRSHVMVELSKFVRKVKEQYKSETRVPRVVWDQVKDMGMLEEFREEMEEWRKEERESIDTHRTHFEDSQEDGEEE